MAANNPTPRADDLKPGEPYIVDGLDWSWAFVVHRPIPGFDDYLAGSDGTIWSRRRPGNHGRFPWKQIKGTRHGEMGYLRARLGRSSFIFVHRLVLTTFVGPCPPGMECRHFPDRDPTNNRLWNLSWGTSRRNYADQRVHGTAAIGPRNGLAKYTEDDRRKVESSLNGGLSHRKAAVVCGVSRAFAREVQRKLFGVRRGRRSVIQRIGEPPR